MGKKKAPNPIGPLAKLQHIPQQESAVRDGLSVLSKGRRRAIDT